MQHERNPSKNNNKNEHNNSQPTVFTTAALQYNNSKHVMPTTYKEHNDDDDSNRNQHNNDDDHTNKQQQQEQPTRQTTATQAPNRWTSKLKQQQQQQQTPLLAPPPGLFDTIKKLSPHASSNSALLHPPNPQANNTNGRQRYAHAMPPIQREVDHEFEKFLQAQQPTNTTNNVHEEFARIFNLPMQQVAPPDERVAS